MTAAASAIHLRNHRLGKDAKPEPVERHKSKVIFLHVREDACEHVAAWELWKKMHNPAIRPMDFAKMFCRLRGVELEALYRRRGKPNLVDIRRSLAFALVERYPQLSSPQVGRILQRDHTTVLYLLGRTKSAKRNMKVEE